MDSDDKTGHHLRTLDPQLPPVDIRGQPTGIGHLPTELLCMIFKLVYRSSREKENWEGVIVEEEDVSKWPDDDDLNSPSIFPYAISTICRHWEAIMEDVPAYWTRLIIHVGPGETPVNNIVYQLWWSRQLPFSLTATRRKHTEDGSQALEKAQLDRIMDLLGRNLHRLISLHFNVLYAGSLPALCREPDDDAPRLTSLKLGARLRDGFDSPGCIVESPGDIELDLLYPQLHTLHLAGHSICDALAHQWLRHEGIQCLSLSLSHGAISLAETLTALQALPSLAVLEIRHVTFTLETPARTNTRPSSRFVRLLLDNLDGEAVRDILLFTQDLFLEDLEFINCPLLVCDANLAPRAMSFHFKEMRSEEDMLRFLHLWTVDTFNNGDISLEFTDCPCFTDALLASLTSSGEDGDSWALPGASYLHIHSCHAFSGQALRRMVEARFEGANNPRRVDAHRVEYVWSFEELVIKGCGAVLSEEDQAWLEAHVSLIYTVD
ncbi:hypothetical protein PLICRDRAFT_219555 [Plicaturopsis crispa FD-325 SS-3]|nr:hypothetical protein PLICRDRAFT_219555 [Plicaturopsis crispa FD-325 SS-3]